MWLRNEYVKKMINTGELNLYKREKFSICSNILKDNNLCIIGLRQIGKTTLIEQLGYEFIKNKNKDNKNELFSTVDIYPDIFYTNLKSIFNINKDNEKVWESLKNELCTKKYKLVIIDEIQELKNWSNLLQTLIDFNKDTKFIVSGSNAISLNNEIMVGRMKIIDLLPLTFNEYKNIWNDDDIENYLKYGSYPKSRYDSVSIQYHEIIESLIIDKVVIDDLKNKPDIHKFKFLLADINNYVGNEFNMSNVEKKIDLSRQTVSEYIKMMNISRLINCINRYNDKNSKRKVKIYYEDKSMIYWFSQKTGMPFNNNLLGSLIENEIFLKLKNKYNYNLMSLDKICYFRDKENKEIDFILEREKLLIECKYCNEINWELLTKELNKIISEHKEISDFKKIIISKNDNIDNINGWKILSLNTFLEDKYE